MLSMTEGEEIAINTEGRYKGEVIHITKDSDDFKPWASPKYIIQNILIRDPEFISKTKKLKYSKKMLLLDMLDDNEDNSDAAANSKKQELIEDYNNSIVILEKIYKREIFLPDAKFRPLINIAGNKNKDAEHLCYLIAAKSGSGKSTFAAGILKQIREQAPEKKFYLISYLKEDKAYDFLKESGEEIIRIPTDGDEGYENFCSGKSGQDAGVVVADIFKDSVIVFDDIESIGNKKIHDGVLRFQKSILQTCRHNKTISINISHELQNWSKTKELLTEATHIVLFPAFNAIQCTKFFKSQYAMSQPMLDKILLFGKESRWIQLCRKIPNYILFEKGCLILN